MKIKSPKAMDLSATLRWIKPFSMLLSNVSTRRIGTATLYHLLTILWYHMKHLAIITEQDQVITVL